MNDAPYSLRLVVTWKVLLLVFGGLAAVVIAVCVGIVYNEKYLLLGGKFDLIWSGVILFGGIYSLFRLGKVWCTYAAQIALASEGMLVYDNTGVENILYNNIASYRYEAFNEGHALRIRLLNGESRKFNSGGQFVTDDEAAVFADMMRDFESSISNYQQQQGSSASMLREKTFFEKPIATVFLVICSLLIVASIVMMVVNHQFIAGSFISFLGLFIPFAMAWYNARRPKQNDKFPLTPAAPPRPAVGHPRRRG